MKLVMFESKTPKHADIGDTPIRKNRSMHNLAKEGRSQSFNVDGGLQKDLNTPDKNMKKARFDCITTDIYSENANREDDDISRNSI